MFCQTAMREPGELVGKNAGLVTERLRVRIPAGSGWRISYRVNFVC